MSGAASTVAAATKAAGAAAQISPFGPLNTSLISIMITLLVLIMKNQIANRKMTIQVNGEVRKEFIDEMAALRGEVKSSREESEGLRDEVRTLRQEVRKRDDKIDQLRDEVRSLHGVIDGMRRDNLQSGLSTQRAVVDSLPRAMVPPSTLAALDRLKGTGE